MLEIRGNFAIYAAVFGLTMGLPFASLMKPPTKRSSVTTKAGSGEQVYRQKCASCHGAKGEGGKTYSKALTGQQSVEQLTRFIGKSMPPGKPCSAPEAKKVATYIYDAFYSPIAYARVRPARVDLSRLTVRQYYNTIVDLVGSFRSPQTIDTQRGLKAIYFKTRHIYQGKVFERVDPVVDFDFGTNVPKSDKQSEFDPRHFSILWTGSLLAPETGEYEITVRTDQAIRLWVNNPKRAFIDATVKSGSDKEHRATISFVGGRAYPIRLEFMKANQGVDDSEKSKKLPPTHAAITLEWKPPKGEGGAVPTRYLLPTETVESFALDTRFPPDDRSIGYERGNAISKAWDDATTEGALATTHYLMDHLATLAGFAENDKEIPKKIKAFCLTLAERAFRRPLSPELKEFYIEKQFREARDLENALKRVSILVLKSPRFLYREAGTGNADPYTIASRLSFGLWDSMPDAELLKAAEKGELNSREQVQKQAERMAQDPRAWFKLREFMLMWLKADQYPDLAKDNKTYPDFDAKTQADLRASLELFLEGVIWNDRSDFRELLLTDKMVLNGRLAKLYGVNLPSDAAFQTISLDPQERAGILTHPYMMASFSYLKTTSPIHRGVWLARNVLGRTLNPPPIAVAPVAPDLQPNLTTRQRVQLQTKPAACMGCHNMINPLGYPLEKFDALGRLRTQENNQPVDTNGFYQARTGQNVKFESARDLANFLANSEETHHAFVERLFHYFVKQPIRAYGAQNMAHLQRTFTANNYNIRRQMVEAVIASAWRGV
jgi:hypothetical protein